MRLTPAEIAYVRSKGLYLTEKCDGCGRLLNHTSRYTIAGRAEVYCSLLCRDRVFFGEKYRARKAKPDTPVKCTFCGGTVHGKRDGSLFCSSRCKQANWRAARKTRKSATSRNTALIQSTSCGGQ
jgi:endogenous inhibitor of DNA gyrase (YacG/DUF329 family)